MTAEQISAAVMNSVHRAGLVEVEVSARHVHLSQADAEVLFGPGVGLEPARPLSQPGQFLSQQRVTLIGPKGRKERTAVLGPVRPASQVERPRATAWSWAWTRPCGSPATWPAPAPSSLRAPAAPWS